MGQLPEHLKYCTTHEWVYLDEQGLAVVGITDFAQESLGDLVNADLPEVGETVSAGDDIMVLESVKTASDIHAPISGEIVAVNNALEDEPELVNDEPYDAGWLFKIKPDDIGELEDLFTAEDYQAEIDG
ncbi:glycine cleavage system protein GcvH [Thiomicrospira sp. ALE5]|uniref:glycine cleavage system protein GcvH n=1 Tax=Thiomicrospira sp. ALE5 TaxID=748650 RepID=UPI0008EB2161|nr:glycine cleavage system protein GcvH [Thiomicrospira sp. ALE5]SFR61355.1 glycine cleavage system H protein [Thiomicrospira sp. ALE5]